MSKFQAISITLKCGKCDKETKVVLPIVISEDDWITTKQNFERLNKGENPFEIYHL